MSDADPWYRDGLSFRCTRCGDCCRGEGYVWVEGEEIDAIARYLDLDRGDFGRRYLRRVGAQPSLVDAPSGDCVFWEEGRGCTIYPVRPSQCRTFPFWGRHIETPQAWEAVTRSCPGAGEGLRYDLVRIRRLAAGDGETGERDPAQPPAGARARS